MDETPTARFSADELAGKDTWKLASTPAQHHRYGVRQFVCSRTKTVVRRGRRKTVPVFKPVAITDDNMVVYSYGPTVHHRPLPATYALFLKMLREIHFLSKKMYTKLGNKNPRLTWGWEGATYGNPRFN